MNRLEELIPKYASHKAKLDSMKKVCDEENKEIKKIMTNEQITEFSIGDWKAVRTIQKRQSIDEEKLLFLAHQIDELTPIIKTKEYIDFDLLENLLYHGLISKDTTLEINRTRTVKEIPTLRVSKKKEAD